jgi:hypothetical protein
VRVSSTPPRCHLPVSPVDCALQGRFAVTAGTIAGLARLPALRALETAYTVAPAEAPAALDEFAALTGARPAAVPVQHAALCRLWLPAREGRPREGLRGGCRLTQPAACPQDGSLKHG